MKRRGECRMNPGEGRLVAAAAVLVLAFSLAVYLESIPPGVEILPVHSVPDAGKIERAKQKPHAMRAAFVESFIPFR